MKKTRGSIFSGRRCAVTALLAMTNMTHVSSFSHQPPTTKSLFDIDHNLRLPSVIRKLQACALSAAILASTQCAYLPHDTSSYVHAATDISSATTANLERALDGFDSIGGLKNGLSQPTEERPQIKPPAQLATQAQSASALRTKTNEPIMQGLVSMLDKYERPDPSEIIVLTLSSASTPDEILAGAKYPVYRARLPFNFQMFEANILKGKTSLYKDAVNGDFIITATVCPQDAVKLPCSTEESSYTARGISKLLQVPGMEEGDLVRTPATLPLQKSTSM